MRILLFFEIFLLAVCFYSLFYFSGLSKHLVPLACLFCIFWVYKLERKMKEEEEARKRLLEFRMEKHRENVMAQKAAEQEAVLENTD